MAKAPPPNRSGYAVAKRYAITNSTFSWFDHNNIQCRVMINLFSGRIFIYCWTTHYVLIIDIYPLSQLR